MPTPDEWARLMASADLTPEKIDETVTLVGQTADAVLGHEGPNGERRGGMLERFTNIDHVVLGVPVNGHREGGVVQELHEIKTRMSVLVGLAASLVVSVVGALIVALLSN